MANIGRMTGRSGCQPQAEAAAFSRWSVHWNDPGSHIRRISRL